MGRFKVLMIAGPLLVVGCGGSGGGGSVGSDNSNSGRLVADD